MTHARGSQRARHAAIRPPGRTRHPRNPPAGPISQLWTCALARALPYMYGFIYDADPFHVGHLRRAAS